MWRCGILVSPEKAQDAIGKARQVMFFFIIYFKWLLMVRFLDDHSFQTKTSKVRSPYGNNNHIQINIAAVVVADGRYLVGDIKNQF